MIVFGTGDSVAAYLSSPDQASLHEGELNNSKWFAGIHRRYPNELSLEVVAMIKEQVEPAQAQGICRAHP